MSDSLANDLHRIARRPALAAYRRWFGQEGTDMNTSPQQRCGAPAFSRTYWLHEEVCDWCGRERRCFCFPDYEGHTEQAVCADCLVTMRELVMGKER